MNEIFAGSVSCVEFYLFFGPVNQLNCEALEYLNVKRHEKLENFKKFETHIFKIKKTS